MEQQLKQAENLSKQLEELEMLRSIYPGSGELIVTDRTIISDARDFVAASGDSSVILRKLSFVVNVSSLEV